MVNQRMHGVCSVSCLQVQKLIVDLSKNSTRKLVSKLNCAVLQIISFISTMHCVYYDYFMLLNVANVLLIAHHQTLSLIILSVM